MRVAETVAQDSIEADKTHATSPPLCTPEPPLNTTKSFGTDHDIKSQMKPSEEITHGSTECTSNEVLYVEGKHAWMRNSSATQDRSRPEDSVIDRAHHGRLVQAPAAPSSRQSSSRARDTGAPHARRAQGEKITFGKTHAGKTFEDVWLTYWIKWFLQHFAESGKMEHRRIIKLIKLKIEEAENHPETLQAPCLPKAKAAPKILAAKAKARPTDVSEVNMEILSAMESEAPWVIAEEQSPTSAWSIWKMLCTRFWSI